MSKFAIRSDMEGLSGVVTWEEVIPGAAPYEKSKTRLQQEIDALCGGLIEGGAERIEIYDEHYYGLNMDVGLLRPGTILYRGKPPYTSQWLGGVDSTFSGLILQGYHAMAGVEGGLLSHTYEPDIQAIRINGRLVGEIGVEAAIAGDVGVPFAMYLGDFHGAMEATELVPSVETVVVKNGMGSQMGLCRNWPDIRAEIVDKAKRIAQQKASGILHFAPPIRMEIDLNDGPYCERLFCIHGSLRIKDNTLALNGASVADVWAKYWAMKNDILVQLKQDKSADA